MCPFGRAPLLPLPFVDMTSGTSQMLEHGSITPLLGVFAQWLKCLQTIGRLDGVRNQGNFCQKLLSRIIIRFDRGIDT